MGVRMGARAGVRVGVGGYQGERNIGFGRVCSMPRQPSYPHVCLSLMVCALSPDRAEQQYAAHVGSRIQQVRAVPRNRGAFAGAQSRRQRRKQRECLGGRWCGVPYVWSGLWVDYYGVFTCQVRGAGQGVRATCVCVSVCECVSVREDV